MVVKLLWAETVFFFFSVKSWCNHIHGNFSFMYAGGSSRLQIERYVALWSRARTLPTSIRWLIGLSSIQNQRIESVKSSCSFSACDYKSVSYSCCFVSRVVKYDINDVRQVLLYIFLIFQICWSFLCTDIAL